MRKYQAASGYVIREFLGECLLIPVGSPGDANVRMAILNMVGQFLWEQLQSEKTEAELLEAVCGEFEVTCETAAEDIRAFLMELEKHHCIVKMEE